jgi:RND family efflux transporter MFP subunit
MRRYIFGIAITAALVVAAPGFFISYDHKAAALERKSAVQPPSLTVNVVRPVSSTFAHTIAATGSVMPRDELIIGSDASGIRLVEVLAEVGSVVRKGQLLARADDAQLQAQLAQQKALVKQAEVELAQARANSERAEKLKDSGIYSTETYQTRKTSADAAAAKLDVAIAQKRELEVRISHTRVYAPASGVISKKSATVGAVVQPGLEMFRLIRDGELEWLAELPSHSIAKVHPGARAHVLLDDGTTVEGKVRLVAPTMDTATRSGLVHVTLPADARLKAGALARGEVLLANANALALPEASILSRDGFPFVYVVGSDNIARLAKVETGVRQHGLVEIVSGVGPEARIVSTGAGFVKDGDLVHIAPQSAAVADAGPGS